MIRKMIKIHKLEDGDVIKILPMIDKDDKIIDRWFGKTIIHSDRRFTYEEAQEILDKGEGEFHDELKKLDILSKKLRKARFKKGSIDFDADEVRFRLDAEGSPLEVYVKERIDTNMQRANYLTKGLPRETFEKERKMTQGW